MEKKWWVWTVVGLVSATVALPGRADPPATAGAVQIGVGLRYGFELEEGDFNPWGLGLGLDGGVTMQNAVYVGGNAEYYFGETVDTPGGEASGNIWQLTAEGGYDVGLGPNFVIRPKLGLGIGSWKSEVCFESIAGGDECMEDSSTDFAATPGANFIFASEKFTLDIDVRYDMIFADPETLNALLFSVGVGF
jgi:hypothetical protein